jgi:hypothetical protein
VAIGKTAVGIPVLAGTFVGQSMAPAGGGVPTAAC